MIRLYMGGEEGRETIALGDGLAAFLVYGEPQAGRTGRRSQAPRLAKPEGDDPTGLPG